MIHYLVTAGFTHTIAKLVRGLGRDAQDLIAWLTYEDLFKAQAAPAGHYVFTDLDRLGRYETDAASAFAQALEREAPDARILNHPLHACERVPLLRRLHRAGFNDFGVLRLDTGEVPKRYPVFIRATDGCGGPETEVIRDAAGFEAAVLGLARRGLPLKGRAAIGYAGERGADGFFRKYGAFRIGDAVVPQHLMCGDDWVVKKNSARIGFAQAQEELAYVRDNPHAEELLNAFRIGAIEFGRVDYGFRKEKLQVFEINTNPSFPNFMPEPVPADERSERRVVIRAQFLAALRALDTPHDKGHVRFALPRPVERPLRPPPADAFAEPDEAEEEQVPTAPAIAGEAAAP